MLLHVTDFDGNIVDSFGNKNQAIVSATHTRNKTDDSELLDITIATREAEEFQEYRHILIQDENGLYRDFIINRSEKENNGYSLIEATASYLIEIGNSRSIPAGKYTRLIAKQALYEVLRGTGWEAGTVEWAGEKSMSWTSERTPYEMLKQLCTAYGLELDFTYEVDDKGIVKKFVHMYKKKALFNGKEIKKGKDLISLKRVSDATELNTALIALGPEKDDGTRLRIEVVDDNAQAQFGLTKRYIWGIYEPESEDSTMTVARLKTLATTELNKRKTIDVSYEVDALDIKNHFPHETTRFGDMVRIKDPDFTPALYAEAEVTGIEHDLVADVRTYTFGTPKEFKESDLRKYFNERLAMIQKQMKDNNTNVNTIIETVTSELDKVERKVHRGTEPPEQPTEGQFWFDTSNPQVAVLREYVNGEWINSTAETVTQIGGLTREQIIYRELKQTYASVFSEHARLQTLYNDLVNSEYLVNLELKAELETVYNNVLNAFTDGSTKLENIKEETATIGALMNVQESLVIYRNHVQEFYILVNDVQKSIDERLKFLQVQYTEEKFNEAMQNVAEKLGFELTDDGFLVGDGTLISGAIQALRDDTDEQFKTVVKSVEYETDKKVIIERLNGADSTREQLDKLIKDRVTLTEYNKMKIGTHNLLLNSKERSDLFGSSTHRRIVYQLTEPLKVGQEYTLTFDMEVTSGDNFVKTTVLPYEPSNGSMDITIDNSIHNKLTFLATVPSTLLLIYSAINSTTENDTTEITVTNAMLVEGNKIGDYSQAPKEQEERLNTMETSIEQNGKEIELKASEEEFNKTRETLSKTLAEIIISTNKGVQLIYDENGNVSDFTVGSSGVSIDTKKLTIEAGDVSLKNGVFTVNQVNTKNVTIPRDDGGVPTILNGLDRQAGLVTGMEPMFSSMFGIGNNLFTSEIFKSGTWYGVFKRFANMSNQGYARVNAYYFLHTRRYLRLPYIVHVGYDADDKGNTPTGIYMDMIEFGNDDKYGDYRIAYNKLTTTSNGGSTGIVNYEAVIDLGPPTGDRRQFYVRVKPNGEGVVGGNTGTDPRTWTNYSVCKFAFRPFELYG